MQFLHRTVSLLVVVCASSCTAPGICSDDGVFLGIARDREDIAYERIVSLQTIQPTESHFFYFTCMHLMNAI